MNLKTFRFLVHINNQSPGIIIEQKGLNAYQAQKAVEAMYGPNAKVSFYGMINEKN